jgi:hypothetical protein
MTSVILDLFFSARPRQRRCQSSRQADANAVRPGSQAIRPRLLAPSSMLDVFPTGAGPLPRVRMPLAHALLASKPVLTHFGPGLDPPLSDSFGLPAQRSRRDAPGGQAGICRSRRSRQHRGRNAQGQSPPEMAPNEAWKTKPTVLAAGRNLRRRRLLGFCLGIRHDAPSLCTT